MNFETVIGLEIHAELNTKTKIFCGCSTEFGAAPNDHTCPVCLGLPGSLPVLNEEVVNLAVKAGLCLNCSINALSKMDRKNYFYPDLPKAYQISQYDLPIAVNGIVEFKCEDKNVKVRINRVHIEEDAGKLIHLEEEPYSLIDYNRVGVPLIEIVSEPDMRSTAEAVTFLKTLRSILDYNKISDCKMEQGSLRCDANISIREVGQENYNTKVEIKNINSFRELQKALEKEEKRQKELYQFNEEYKVVQETRRWDSGKGRTISMRSKEDAHDYRYFPEPDIPLILVKKEKIQEIKSSISEMPLIRKERFINEYGLSEKESDILIDDKSLGEFYESLIKINVAPKVAANWILGDTLRLLKEKNVSSDKIPVTPLSLFNLISFIDKGTISITIGKQVFEEMFLSGKSSEVIIKEKGLSQISSSDELSKIIDEIIASNPKSIEDFKNGKMQAAGFLMGQVMKASKGTANPKKAKELLDEKLQSL